VYSVEFNYEHKTVITDILDRQLNSIMARVIEQAQNPHGEFGSELQKT
jgi:hypothetical protein